MDNFKRYSKLVLGLVLLILAIIFMVQNTEIVEVALFFWKVSMPRSLLVFVLLLIGASLGFLAGHIWRGRQKE